MHTMKATFSLLVALLAAVPDLYHSRLGQALRRRDR